jgi:Ca2+-binding RTX toxin-like protein
VVLSSTAGSCSSIRPVACRLGNLARDETVTVTLKATAAATGTSSLTFAVGDSVPDPNVAANNRVTVSTHIAAIPAVSTSPCTIRGTEGSDTLVGTAGRDVICGLDGNDTIRALGGNDLVFGGRGADRIFGGAGADRLYGGADDDILEGDSGRDVLSGEAGNDSLRARDRARDSVFGGPGRDHAVADRLLDRVRGVESVVRGWPV